MSLIHGLRFDNIRGDIYDGLTAAVVALPLALAFGVASGAGPVAGLYGAICIGFFAALFGRTPISGSLHAIVLLAVVLGLGGLAEHIPHAVLAGTLIKVGIDIVDWGYLRRLREAPRAGLFFMLVVLLLTVFVDLITAVGVGVVMASLLFVKRMADLQLANIRTIAQPSDEASLTPEESALLEAGHGCIILYHLTGPFGFGAAKGMARQLAAADQYDVPVLDLSDVPMLDSSASLAVEDTIMQVQSRGKHILLVGLRPVVSSVLKRLGVLKQLQADCQHESRLSAVRHAVRLIGVDTAQSVGA